MILLAFTYSVRDLPDIGHFDFTLRALRLLYLARGRPPVMVAGMAFITSPLLPDIRHGFTTRHGGVSEGAYASFNLGEKWGDDPKHVSENYVRLAKDARFPLAKFFAVEQVHGREVLTLDGTEAPAIVRTTNADALATKTPGLVLGVRTADCVPIILCDDQGHVAVVHAGWRGTAAGVVSAALDVLFTLAAKPENIRAAIGPCICPKCFEVGEEVAHQFEQVAPAAIIREEKKRPHIDLAAVNHLQLLEGGVSPDNVWRSGRCTMHEGNDFFSFRRDGQKTGQQVTFVCS